MNKLKAKEDLPSDVRLKHKSPVLLLMTDKKIPDGLMDGLGTLDINVVMLSKHMDIYEKLLWASDMMLILSDTPEKYLSDAWHNGVVPVTLSSAKDVSNYNPNKETGNGFTFDNENTWEIFAALVRALETFKFPYDWEHIIRQAQKVL